MIASNRKISRLPISVFEDLLTSPAVPSRKVYVDDPESLKSIICQRLRKFTVLSTNSKNGGRSSTTCGIKTIGQLLRFSKCSLLLALDPILTYEEIGLFLRRICRECTPNPLSAIKMMRRTIDRQSLDQNIQNIREHLFHQQQAGSQKHVPAVDNDDPIVFGNQMRFLPTGLVALDEALLGGLRVGTVTEIVGKSGVGKTQLALQLCVMAAQYNQGAIYMDTEKKMKPPRLREMGQEWRKLMMAASSSLPLSNDPFSRHTAFHFSYDFHESYPTPRSQDIPNPDGANASDNSVLLESIGAFKSVELLLGNLSVHHPNSTEDLLSKLASLEDEILRRNQIASQRNSIRSAENDEGNTISCRSRNYPVRLLIVDSIAAPVRRDFGADSAPQRAAAVFQCAQILKRLADQLHLCVVVINQVSGTSSNVAAMGNVSTVTRNNIIIDSNTSHAEGIGTVSDPFSSWQAALGMSWYHCVSTRLVMENESGTDPDNPTGVVGDNVAHRISIRKSCTAPFVQLPFQIVRRGIADV